MLLNIFIFDLEPVDRSAECKAILLTDIITNPQSQPHHDRLGLFPTKFYLFSAPTFDLLLIY